MTLHKAAHKAAYLYRRPEVSGAGAGRTRARLHGHGHKPQTVACWSHGGGTATAGGRTVIARRTHGGAPSHSVRERRTTYKRPARPRLHGHGHKPHAVACRSHGGGTATTGGRTVIRRRSHSVRTTIAQRQTTYKRPAARHASTAVPVHGPSTAHGPTDDMPAPINPHDPFLCPRPRHGAPTALAVIACDGSFDCGRL